MPSVRFCARPSGNTSTSLAVKSVSRAEVAAYNTTRTGPMTSTSLRRGAVVYTSTSRRCSTARWSFGPQGNTFGLQQAAPPAVGTGSCGSNTNRSAAPAGAASSAGAGTGKPAPPPPAVGTPRASRGVFIGGRVQAKPAIARQRVGMPAALQVEALPMRARRPLPLLAPAVHAHHKHPHGSLRKQRRVFAFQKLVEPLHLNPAQRHIGIRSEVHAVQLRRLVVGPRPDQYAVHARALAQAFVSLQIALHEIVEPSAH